MSERENEKPLPDGDAYRISAPDVDAKALRRARLKLDCIFLPALTFVYFLNFLDRANIGNAKAAGLQTDLKLTSTQYSLALTTTYIPYIVAELPLTLAIKKVGPHRLIPALVVSWGLVTTFQGFVHNYSGLLAARFFLGVTEGAILPSSMAYMSLFYARAPMGKRVAFYFSATSLAGAFSGLLAAALLNMHGLGGKKGWQWIFIIEGLFTVVYGFAAFFLLTENPQRTWYLSSEEKEAVMAELRRDQPEEHGGLTLKAVLSAFKAPQMWLMFIQFFGSGCMLYAMAYFTPTIVAALGYKGTKIQLYSVPPYVCSAFFALFISMVSDRVNHRSAFIVFAAAIAVAGYGLYLTQTNAHVLYGSLFLMIIGSYLVAPLQSVHMPNNLAPFYKRTTGIVMGFISTNSGGILSTWLFPGNEAPRFKRGTSVLLAMSAMIMGVATLNGLYLHMQNRRRDAAARASGQSSEEEGYGGIGGFKEEDAELGDLSPRFRYIT